LTAVRINRRRENHPRFPIRVPAVSEPMETPGRPEPAEAQDLSRGGMLLQLAQALAPGAPVRVTLSLQRRPPLVLEGTVAWVRPDPDVPGWALGIRFAGELPGELVAEIALEEHPPWGRPPARDRGSEGA